MSLETPQLSSRTPPTTTACGGPVRLNLMIVNWMNLQRCTRRCQCCCRDIQELCPDFQLLPLAKIQFRHPSDNQKIRIAPLYTAPEVRSPMTISVKLHLTDKRTNRHNGHTVCLSVCPLCSFVGAHVRKRFLTLFWYIRISKFRRWWWICNLWPVIVQFCVITV